jgi:hypothetical protein
VSKLGFKDGDAHLSAAGVYNSYPVSRGVYTSFDKNLIIWLNECDHLKVMFRRETSESAEWGKAYRSFAKAMKKLDLLDR